MIFGICILLIFLGTAGLAADLFIPVTTIEMAQIVGVSNLFGLMFVMLGVIILGVRIYQTRISPLLDMPNSSRVILFHHRRGKNPNVILHSGKLMDLEYIKTKDKLFKDTGGGFRIAGHDCRSTHETIAFDLPEWMMDYFHKIKTHYGIHNREEFKQLVEKLSMIKSSDTGLILESKLSDITLLRKIMNDDRKKEVLLGLGAEKIRHLAETCCDGMTHHHEEIEDFIDSATPNELDALVKQSYLNDRMKDANYRDPGSNFNYEALIPIGIGMFIAVLATIVFMSYMGGG